MNYFIFEPKGFFTYKHILAGMIFPLAYWSIFVAIGGMIDFYPYFFMNIPNIGLPMALVWLMAMLGAFVIFGFLLVKFDNIAQKKYCNQ
jgi:hypothetical protein